MIHCYASRFTLVLIDRATEYSSEFERSLFVSPLHYCHIECFILNLALPGRESAFFSLSFLGRMPLSFQSHFFETLQFFLKHNMESKDTSASFLNDPRAQSVGRLMTESRFHGDISHRRLFNKLFTRKQDGELTDHFHASNVVLQHHSISFNRGYVMFLSISEQKYARNFE